LLERNEEEAELVDDKVILEKSNDLIQIRIHLVRKIRKKRVEAIYGKCGRNNCQYSHEEQALKEAKSLVLKSARLSPYY
jgi:hypothetical protein